MKVTKKLPQARIAWMAVAWASFLAACVLEMLVFALFDPSLLSMTHEPSNLSTKAVYSLGFLVIWAVTFAACTLTAWLANTTPSNLD